MIDRLWPNLVPLFVQITLIAVAALTLSATLLRRRAAARHAMLVCALLVIAAAPVWTWIALRLHWRAPISLPTPLIIVTPLPTVADAAPRTPTVLPEQPVRDWRPILTMWPLVSALLLVRLFVSIARLHYIARRATPHATNIKMSSDVSGPVCAGVLRPCVLLPPELVDRLSPDELRQALAHELAHILGHDSLVALLQQIVAALWWPHPLVHLLNRQIDRAREERCDNAVLVQTPPAEYARTLVRIAEWMNDRPETLTPALALIRRAPLRRRIDGILDERRNLMTRTRWSFVFATALTLCAAAVLISCSTSARAGDANAPASVAAQSSSSAVSIAMHPVSFELGQTQFEPGDSITIDQVYSTSDNLSPGDIIIAKGHYTLASHDEAMLALFITSSGASGWTDVIPQQKTNVKKGSGTFELRHTLVPGQPHVSFYGGGSGIGGVYFGKGESLHPTQSSVSAAANFSADMNARLQQRQQQQSIQMLRDELARMNAQVKDQSALMQQTQAQLKELEAAVHSQRFDVAAKALRSPEDAAAPSSSPATNPTAR